MSVSFFSERASIASRSLLDCLGALWTGNTSSERDEPSLFSLFALKVGMAINLMPRIRESSYEPFSVIKKNTIINVLGHDCAIDRIFQKYAYVGQVRAAPHNKNMEGIRRRHVPMSSADMPSLTTIAEEPSSECVIEIDMVYQDPISPSFDPAEFFSASMRSFALQQDEKQIKALHFLQSKLHLIEPLSLDVYLDLHSIVTGQEVVSLREHEKITYCLSPAFIKRAWNKTSGEYIDLDFERDGFGTAEFLRYCFDQFSLYELYELCHLSVFVKERVTDAIFEFNAFIDESQGKPPKEAMVLRFRAICYLFFRIQQLQPVENGEHTSLLLVNFLLARYGLPLTQFSETTICCGEMASIFSLTSLEGLQHQMKNGMSLWCKINGYVMPF